MASVCLSGAQGWWDPDRPENSCLQTPKPAPPPKGRLRGFGSMLRMRRHRLNTGRNLQVFFWEQAETFWTLNYNLFLPLTVWCLFGSWMLVGDLSLKGRKRRIRQMNVILTLYSSKGHHVYTQSSVGSNLKAKSVLVTDTNSKMEAPSIPTPPQPHLSHTRHLQAQGETVFKPMLEKKQPPLL